MVTSKTNPLDASDPYAFPRYPLLIVISGPAGVGKDSVLEGLKERGCPLHFVVTATDRPPRPGEVHGVDYYFYETSEFLRMEQEGELLEHAIVYGQHKGVPTQQVREALASGMDAVMRVDVQGAATIRRLAQEAVQIFIAPSSEEELEARLRGRDADSPEQVDVRLEMAYAEMRRAREFDYVVINRQNELDQAVEQVIHIIEAEHCRMPPRVLRL